MSDDTPTRGVKVATLQENFALRDEIKQLRILLAAIIRGCGGLVTIPMRLFVNIHSDDRIHQEHDAENDCVILTFEGKP